MPESTTMKAAPGDVASRVPADVQGDVLKDMLRTGMARDLQGNVVSINSAISAESVIKLQQLAASVSAKRTLEVGCAMGVSTLALLYTLQELGGGSHMAIDPNQTGRGPDQWRGIALAMVGAAGLSANFQLLEEPSHVALPRLLAEGERFDLIFIDGWHSFDYTFVDYFYSDLLLRERGILVFDDAGMPQVHEVCRFVETHKAYQRLGGAFEGPPMNPFNKLKHRLLRRDTSPWGSIQAYRKLRTTTVPWSFWQSNFYPYFWMYRYWMTLRGLERRYPYPAANNGH